MHLASVTSVTAQAKMSNVSEDVESGSLELRDTNDAKNTLGTTRATTARPQGACAVVINALIQSTVIIGLIIEGSFRTRIGGGGWWDRQLQRATSKLSRLNIPYCSRSAIPYFTSCSLRWNDSS
jgi:hypothetical protein